MNASALRDSSPRPASEPMMNTAHIQTDSAALITDTIFISLFAVSGNGLPWLSVGSTPVVSPILEGVRLHSCCVWSVCVYLSI